MRQLVASCRTHGFSELVLERVAGRSASISHVLGHEGPHGLLAIAEEVGATMDQLPPEEKAHNIVGAEFGVLIGIALGLAINELRTQMSVATTGYGQSVH
jgi:hypothetical protein